MRFLLGTAILAGLHLLLGCIPLPCDCFLISSPNLSRQRRFLSTSVALIAPRRIRRHYNPSRNRLHLIGNDDASDENDRSSGSNSLVAEVLKDPERNLSFSALMVTCGAALGPFLDSYHSAFGVLQYDNPIYFQLWGSELKPALITSWWVPELFGLAGFIIGWLYIVLDKLLQKEKRDLTPPLILLGISLFTCQYWLSGVLFAMGMSRSSILGIMSIFSAVAFYALDGTWSGFITSTATALGGPLIEVGLLTFLRNGGYHYTDSGELGFFPLWIVPVYFLGGPAVGNLARGFWVLLSVDNAASASEKVATGITSAKIPPGCQVCNDSRCVGCPNCDAEGYYMAYERKVKCNACKGRGLVICRSCFSYYGDDPSDVERIREIMSQIPD